MTDRMKKNTNKQTNKNYICKSKSIYKFTGNKVTGGMKKNSNFSGGFWYGTLPSSFHVYFAKFFSRLEDAKLLATSTIDLIHSIYVSTSAVEWYKSHAHISHLSKVIQILIPT